MKKFFLLVLFVGLFSCIAKAQATEGKPVVYVEYFTCPSNINSSLKESLRNYVIQGIQETNRLEVRDVASQEELLKEAERRKDASAMSDATARTAEMKSLGANYIITGDIVSLTSQQNTSKDGKISYQGNLKYTIKVIDASNGTLHTTKSFEHSTYSNKGSDEALVETCSRAKLDMEDFIDDTFPIAGTILKVETVDKKGTKAQTVYIDLGSAKGFMKGQKFTVYIETDIAGETARTEIGALNAQEVLSANRTLCKVTKGNDKILKAMKEGQKLIVISRRTYTVLDKIL